MFEDGPNSKSHSHSSRIQVYMLIIVQQGISKAMREEAIHLISDKPWNWRSLRSICSPSIHHLSPGLSYTSSRVQVLLVSAACVRNTHLHMIQLGATGMDIAAFWVFIKRARGWGRWFFGSFPRASLNFTDPFWPRISRRGCVEPLEISLRS